MTAVVIVQARLGSQRFPRKILADLCGQPVIKHVIDRARAILGVDRVVLACPEDDLDTLDALGLGVPVIGVTIDGDENDVLSRFCAVAEAYPADGYIRVTGDCPFLAPDLARMAMCIIQQGVCYACTRHDGGASGWPDGLDVEAFSADTLRAADWMAHPGEVEHVTSAMRRLLLSGQQGVIPCPEAWPVGVKLSIDVPADLVQARAIMGRLPAGAYGWEATWRAVTGR